MILRLSAMAMAVAAIAIAFLFVRAETDLAPRGTTHILTIWDPPVDTSVEAAAPFVQQAARHQDISVFKDVRRGDGPTTERTLYVVNRATSGPFSIMQRPPVTLDPKASIRFAPYDELPAAELIGKYETDGSDSSTERFAAELVRQGFSVGVTPITFSAVALWSAEEWPVIPLTAAAALGIVLAGFHPVLTGTRQDAILATHGEGRWRAVRRRTEHLISALLLAAVSTLGIAAPLLHSYNGLAGFALVTTAFGMIIGVSALIAAVMTAVCVLASLQREAGADVAGRRPLAKTALLTTMVHGSALVLLIGMAISSSSTASQLVENTAERDRWLSSPDVYAMSFRINDAQFDAARSAFMDVYEQQDRDGNVVVASHTTPPYHGHGLYDGNAIVANGRFLDDQTVLDAAGRRIHARDIDDEALTLIVPAGVSRSGARTDAKLFLSTESEKASSEGHPITGDVPIRVVSAERRQHVFNYGAGAGDLASTQLDPIIAILPDDIEVLSADWVVSNMTSAGVMFTDADATRSNLTERGLDVYIGGLDRLGDSAEQRITDLNNTFWSSVLASALAMVVILLACVATAALTVERNRRQDFIRLLHGSRRAMSLLPDRWLTSSIFLGFLVSVAHGTDGRLHTVAIALAVVAGDIMIVSLTFLSLRRRTCSDTVRRS
jgi:hypothetical protein